MNVEIEKEMKRLEKAPINKLRERLKELTGKTNRSPNRKFFMRAIREALEAKHASTAKKSARKKSDDRVKSTKESRGGKQPNRGDGLISKTVEELQATLLQEVGRATGSDDKPYLIWKIREARKGKVRKGPARERSAEAADLQHVPFTLPRETVTVMDAARDHLGFKTRQAMLHQAMHDLLASRGENDVAQHFKRARDGSG